MTLSIINSLEIALSAEKQGKWDEAHAIVAKLNHPLAYEIHAYLHRKEGDINNALYWYGRAGVSQFDGALLNKSIIVDSLHKICTFFMIVPKNINRHHDGNENKALKTQ